jgi:hypothetical protein
MSFDPPVLYHRDPMGYWILRHPSGLYPADTPQGFWTPHRMEAMRFCTQAEARACVRYLSAGVISGIRCQGLVVEPLFQM